MTEIPSTDDPTHAWHQVLGLSRESQAELLRQLAEVREEFADTFADLQKARYELKQERLAHAATKAALAASQADLTRAEDRRQRATGLLEYALHLRMHGERAPGGNETWAEFDRRCEAFLREAT
jgi:hypothetical protein